MQQAARAVRLRDNPDVLKARLRAAHSGPGVYVMRDLEARVMYVGKAGDVRSRLRSHFSGTDPATPRTSRMIDRVFDFDVIACASQREALILENSLIKQYRPRFNIRLKDDKNYLYLKIPRPGSADAFAPGTAREQKRAIRGESGVRATMFPRPYYTRKIVRDGARYFGPYTSAQSLRTTVRSLRTIFPFRTCSDEIFRRGRVCLDYHIKRCSGPCEARVDAEQYARLLDQVQLFMEGRSDTLRDELEDQMEGAAARRDYELAARHRDRLRAIDRIAERQTVLRGRRADEDCVAVAVEGGRGMAAVLSARQGKVIDMDTHELEGVTDVSTAEALAGFLPQYYAEVTSLPRRVLISEDVGDMVVLSEFLSEQRGGPVDVRVPQRGDSRRLVERAQETALVALRQQRIVDDYDAAKTETLLEDLATQLHLPAPPRRIECYDISNTMGTNSVGSMVVFEDGRPASSRYRNFGIKTVEGSNDFASLEEMLRRRFRRLQRAAGVAGLDVPVTDPAGSNGEAMVETQRLRRREGATDDRDDSFGILPDLILIDGGKGQLSAAHTVLVEFGLDSIPHFGLAKRNEELFEPGVPEPIVLARESPTLFLVQRVRDEAHRFAITHHRARRGRAALRSKLDIVPGLGPVRRRALLRQFGSIDAIKNASVEDLSEVVPRPVALSVKELL